MAAYAYWLFYIIYFDRIPLVSLYSRNAFISVYILSMNVIITKEFLLSIKIKIEIYQLFMKDFLIVPTEILK